MEKAARQLAQPTIFLQGGGRLHGRPEVGITMYLYFPSEDEKPVRLLPEAGSGLLKHSIALNPAQVMDDTATEGKEAKKSASRVPMVWKIKEMQGKSGNARNGSRA